MEFFKLSTTAKRFEKCLNIVSNVLFPILVIMWGYSFVQHVEVVPVELKCVALAYILVQFIQSAFEAYKASHLTIEDKSPPEKVTYFDLKGCANAGKYLNIYYELSEQKEYWQSHYLQNKAYNLKKTAYLRMLYLIVFALIITVII